MSKTVFLFSGQGSQYPGMGSELAEAYPQVSVFERASEVLGYDLEERIRSSSPEELSRTELAQPAIMAVSLTAFEVMRENGVEFTAVAGHSLGEYAAMAAAGITTLEDGFRVIKARAEAMGRASGGVMYAVIGKPPEEVERVCRETEGYVTAVNYNSPSQTVIAGETEAAERAVKTFGDMGAKTVKLAVSAAFHSELMRGAAEEFEAELRRLDIPFAGPMAPFYSNVTGGELTDFGDMPGRLSRHMVSPVRFTDELRAMAEAGTQNFVELGPGKVLTGLVKKTLKGVNAMNVEDVKSLEKTLEVLNGGKA